MLVLTRKLHEEIRIGDNITVTILRVKGNTVRVGIDAPRRVRVVRGELRQFEDEGAEGSAVTSQPAETDAQADADGAANQSAESPTGYPMPLGIVNA